MNPLISPRNKIIVSDIRRLQFDRLISNNGTQGIVGLLKNGNIFKISKYLDFSMDHEENVFKDLSRLSHIPHFLTLKSANYYELTPNYIEYENPLIQNKNYNVPIKILQYNYTDGVKLSDCIKTIEQKEIISILKQLMCVLMMAQEYCRFTHYDFHLENILIEKCDVNQVNVYYICGEFYVVPTYGVIPVIIDYGYSYTKGLIYSPYTQCSEYYDLGIFPNFDCKYDICKLLYSIRYSCKLSILNNIIDNIYGCDYKPFEAWNNRNNTVHGSFLNTLAIAGRPSRIFSDYIERSIDLIKSVEYFPSNKTSMNYDNISKAFGHFVYEFFKIEKELQNDFLSMYILKVIVIYAQDIKKEYSKATAEEALEMADELKRIVLLEIEKKTEYCIPININYDNMLLSLYIFAKKYVGFLKSLIQLERKNTIIPTTLNNNYIYNIIDTNLQSEYIFNEKTNYNVYTPFYKTTLKKVDHTKLNMMNSDEWGEQFHKIYCEPEKKEQKKEEEKENDNSSSIISSIVLSSEEEN